MKPCAESIIFSSLILISAIVGCCIPAFYEWTGSDQSQPSPLLWQVPLGMLVAAIVFCCVLPWIPIRRETPERDRSHESKRLQFGVRWLLLVTAVVAIVIGVGLQFPAAVTGLISAMAYLSLVWLAIRQPRTRLAMMTLMSCLLLPFLWLYDEAANPVFLGLPGYLPAEVICKISSLDHAAAVPISMFVTASELMLGFVLIRFWPKLALAYFTLLLVSSTTGSLVINAMVRA